MDANHKERLYIKINNCIDSLESRDINSALLVLEGIRKEIQDNIYD